MISINVNPAASGAGLNLSKTNEALQKSLARLSSGRRIVNSSDDAGGQAVSMKMSAALKRTEATSINLRNVTSYLDTQDGALSVANKVMNRLSELSALARDVTKNDGDRENYNKEFSVMKLQLTSLSAEKFNGISLFSDDTAGEQFDVPTSEDGSQLTKATKSPLASDPMMNMMINGFDTFKVESNGETRTFIAPHVAIEWGEYAASYPNAGNPITFGGSTSGVIQAFEIPGGVGSPVCYDTDTGEVKPFNTASGLGPVNVRPVNGNGNDIESGADAWSTTDRTLTISSDPDQTDINYLNSDEYGLLSQEAMQQLGDMRAQNGAEMSRLNFAQDLLNINATNLEAANSRIMDVDVAAESSQLARFQILQQAGTAMLAQANTSQQSLVKLLQG